MIEQRTDDDVMIGHDIQTSPDTTADPSSANLSTADVAGVGSDRQATSMDSWAAETTKPEPQLERQTPAPATIQPEPRIERPTPAPATTADQPAKSAQTKEDSRAPLFAADAAESFRSRWQDIQTGFVDEPRRAVEQADGLVAEVMQHLAKTFADERSQLETQGDHGKDVSTEDLRMALRHYRSFFDRLLSI